MQWFGHFPVSWRTGATFVHDVFAFAVFIVVIGHVASPSPIETRCAR